MRLVLSFALAVIGGLTPPARLTAQPPALVAPTGPLAPADEVKQFTVPQGFEVQLVAAEPDIQKPIQMAFDAKGRLWVTTSRLYPFAAADNIGTDKLYILSDFGPDGKARKIQVFTENLNIPIGILPLPDCNSCIVSSVGEIRKYTDNNGDGKADAVEVLYNGFGTRDTHGMYNSFTLMPDGWVYACHGFSNDSTVKGKDGHEVQMQSGHTFRFRPDGSRIEVYTRGQVNPFGMAVDPWFNLYTADCHSKPITQLIPGAYYQSFGKPHDGLGFAPHVTPHDHGSTALCGLTWYDADQFPKQYKGCMFLGNVVTNRINFDRIEWRGSTPVAKELPDFLVSKDPWFRPADIKLGPDGALYVADFYNKIIGHYEVDLKHPARDKDRGRVWRIVWRGEPGASAPGASAPKMPRPDWTKATDTQLLEDLVSPNMTVRMLAGNELLHRQRTGKEPRPDDAEVLALLQKPETASGVAGWASSLEEAKGNSPNYGQLVEHAKKMSFEPDQFTTLVVRAMASRKEWGERERLVAWDILRSFKVPRLIRATVDALAAHPHADFVEPLVELIQKVPAEDTHLRYAARLALRNCLRDKETGLQAWKKVEEFKGNEAAVVADVAVAVPNYLAAEYLSKQISNGSVSDARLAEFATQIGRYGTFADHKTVIDAVTAPKTAAEKAVSILQGLVRGVQSQGGRLGNANASRILHWSCGVVESGSPASRVAVLRTLADLASVFGEGYRFRGNPELDPVPAVARLVDDAKLGDDLRGSAVDACVKLDPSLGYKKAESLIDNAGTSPALRERAALVLAASADRNHKQAAKDAIQSVPYRSGMAIAAALAGSPAGGGILLDAIKQGKAPARLLQEKAILEKLRAANVPDLDKQVADLTKGLPPADRKLAALIKQRTARFAAAKPDKELGAKLFAKHCAACHKIGEQGGKVGPNLDGVGARGLERLLEDTLDPNRNVDAAFRARVLNLADGTTKTGLMLRVEGEVLVMADDQGKEFRVPTKDIEANRETALSPMPANFGEVIPEAEFYHLLAYLLDQKVKDPPKK